MPGHGSNTLAFVPVIVECKLNEVTCPFIYVRNVIHIWVVCEIQILIFQVVKKLIECVIEQTERRAISVEGTANKDFGLWKRLEDWLMSDAAPTEFPLSTVNWKSEP